MFHATALALALVCLAVMAIVLGGPSRLPPMPSVRDPWRSVDFSDLPALQRFAARDGTWLAYRLYERNGRSGSSLGAVVLVHGSSSRSQSMHPLARGLARAGYAVYALDMRGHGESGEKGMIGYVGQLEDDLEDFVQACLPSGPRSLVGFSAGGGFALRFAADPRRVLFDRYVLLAPFLGQNASTYRLASGGWVSVGVCRLLALRILNRLGITGLNHLPVTAYALTPQAEHHLTPRYAYALAMNFRPHTDHRADLSSAVSPMAVLVGEDDDQFHADRFAAEFERAGRAVPVVILPATGHMDLVVSPSAIKAIVRQVTRLGQGRGECTP